MSNLLKYTLQLADNAMILGQRLSEWCGHGPVLEQDIALSNIALDFIGQARNLYQYAAQVEGKGRTEDDFPFHRNEREFYNVLLVELPNGDFAKTIVRQFLYDVRDFYFYQALKESKDEQLAAIAEKSLKEIAYHLKWSSDWLIRLGDGTEVSHRKAQLALDDLWSYTGELFEMNEVDQAMVAEGVGVDVSTLKPLIDEKIKAVIDEATLRLPESNWMQSGGKKGIHSEYMGHLLAEMQYMQRVYPGMEW